MSLKFEHALLLVPFAAGCLADSADGEVQTSDTNKDPSGQIQTVGGGNDQSPKNPFFHSFGTNGRTCGTCHHEEQGWTITPALATATPTNDPLFVFDGSDCLPPGVPNPNPIANSKMMRSKALVRIDIGIPATADYVLDSFV